MLRVARDHIERKTCAGMIAGAVMLSGQPWSIFLQTWVALLAQLQTRSMAQACMALLDSSQPAQRLSTQACYGAMHSSTLRSLATRSLVTQNPALRSLMRAKCAFAAPA